MRRTVLIALSLLAVLLSFHLLAEEATPEERIRRGDRSFERKTYEPAIEAYREYLAAEPNGEHAFHAGLRIGRSLLGLNRVYEARQHLMAMVPSTPEGTLRRAELLALLAGMIAQHQGGSAQVVGWLTEGEEIYAREGKVREQIEVLFDLALAWSHSWQYDIDYEAWEKEFYTEGAEPEVSFDEYRRRRMREQDDERYLGVVSAHEKIASIAGKDDHRAVLALYRLASFRVSFLAGGFRHGPDYYERGVPGGETNEKFEQFLERYRTEVERGIELFGQIADEHPKDPLADDALFLAATSRHHRQNDFKAGLALYEELLTRYPGSEWRETAVAAAREIRKEDIRLQVEKPFLPGTKPEIGLIARNVEKLAFSAFRLDLPALMEGDYRFHELDSLDLSGRTPIAEWTEETGVADDHKGVQRSITLPFSSPGTFLLHVDGNRRTTRALVVISGLGMALMAGDDQAMVFATDAVTGDPAPGVRLAVKAHWRQGRSRQSRLFSGETDESGLARVDLGKFPTRSVQLEVAGSRGEHPVLSSTWARIHGEGEPFRVYSTTDRPVYRPDQTVHVKVVVRARGEEGFVTPDGQAVRVEILDPRGEKVLDRTLITNRFGSVSADLPLSEEPPLGLWQVRTFVAGRQYYSQGWAGAMFRVEEYKKPEFEVTVEAGEGRVRPGTPVEASVTAKYYFGAPVVGGEVEWRVMRRPYVHWIGPERKYAWYYEDMYPRPSSFWGDELVAEGTGSTDAEGRLEIEFLAKEVEDGLDSRYRVEVDVTDLSRRLISGGATVFATARPFFARIEPLRHLYQPGDSIEVSLRTEDANGRPVAAEGTLELQERVDLSFVDEEGRSVDQIEWRTVETLPAVTGADGGGTVEFVVDQTGSWRLHYAASPEGGEEVTGDTFVWVVTRDFAGSQYRFSGLSVVTAKDTARVGEEMEVLVTTAFPDSHVLVTVAAGTEILWSKVVKTTGKAALVPIPVSECFLPNVFVKALSIRNEAVHLDRREVVVPPESKFLDVSIREQREGPYRPGEEASFTVTATDASGEPAEAELSVSFYDKSILYIQPELSPDIRKFFYGEKRTDGVNLTSSFDFRFVSSDRLKPGLSWPRLRTQNVPQFMNPWFYGFHGYRREMPVPMEQAAYRAEGGGGGDRGLGAPAPGAPTAEMAKGERKSDAALFEGDETADAGGEAPEAPAAERKFFPDSAYFNPHLVTGRDGRAELTVRFPDSLTTWKAISRGVTTGTDVGSAEKEYVVTKNLVLRLQAPRFFRERDEVVVSGIVMNRFDADLDVRIGVAAGEDHLELLDRGELSRPEIRVRVKAGAEQRIDWWFRVKAPGNVTIRAFARSERESDAVSMTFPVLEHGVEKLIALSGGFTGTDGPVSGGRARAQMRFAVPEDRHEDASELVVSVSPSLGMVLLETLPYLADFPWGCTEQTLSRFVPTVVVKKTLEDLGFTLAELGVEPAREVPDGYWGRPVTRKLSVLKAEELDSAVAAGVRRLKDSQNPDGSFGWFAGGSPDVLMTAYVVRGLALARRAGAEVDEDVIRRGAAWLWSVLSRMDPKERREAGHDLSADLLATAASALLDAGRPGKEHRELVGRVLDWLYSIRAELGAVSRARLALALVRLDRMEEARIVLENLTDLATVDSERSTVRFGKSEGYYRWFDDAVEGTAEALRAWLAIDPKSELVPKIVRWLVENRRGAHWKSTKDTAHAVFALAEYLMQSGELTPDLTVEVSIDGRVNRTMRITRENLFTFDNRVVLRGAALPAGPVVVTVVKEGRGNLYYEGHLSVFTREEDVKAAGNGIGITRRIYRVHTRSRERTEKVWVKDHYVERTFTEPYEEREPLSAGAEVRVGDEVEVELEIDAANDYRYLVFEDQLAAGLSPVELLSGHDYSGLLSYREMRDERVAFFVSHLSQGRHRMVYRLRAEIPGFFHKMPARGHAMYLPDIRAISDEIRISVTEDTR